jgi:hypothetical protein
MHIALHKKILLVAGLALCGWSIASGAYAAQITFTMAPQSPAAGEDVAVTVRLDTQKDSLNAVEGSISIPKDLMVEGVNTGGSALSLWPVEPRFVPGSSKVEFAGGVPAGIAPGRDVVLFTITAKASAPGTYAVAPASVRGFRDDGQGTAFSIGGSAAKISVGMQASSEPQAQEDTMPPQFISVEVGQDPALFGGRRYVAFFATDDNSGVSYYEVKEGLLGRYTRADRYYVLSDQGGGSAVWVRAVDAAGNSTVKKIPSPRSALAFAYLGGGILIVLAGIAWMRYVRRKRL